MNNITIIYNGDSNLPESRNHLIKNGRHQLTRAFGEDLESAIAFWLECSFYSGAITTLEELLPIGYESELLNILGEEPLLCEEIFLDNQKELYQLTNEDDEDLLS